MAAHTENSIRINAPLPLVWSITNDLTQWTHLFSEYAAVDILHQAGPTTQFRLTMHPDENGTVWSWVSERTTDPATHTVHAHRVEPGPFEYMNIRWAYTGDHHTTHMTWYQDFQMRPTAPLNDTQMAHRINHNTKTQMNLIKNHLETTHQTTPPPAT